MGGAEGVQQIGEEVSRWMLDYLLYLVDSASFWTVFL